LPWRGEAPRITRFYPASSGLSAMRMARATAVRAARSRSRIHARLWSRGDTFPWPLGLAMRLGASPQKPPAPSCPRERWQAHRQGVPESRGNPSATANARAITATATTAPSRAREPNESDGSGGETSSNGAGGYCHPASLAAGRPSASDASSSARIRARLSDSVSGSLRRASGRTGEAKPCDRIGTS
jgi:hypothetical protein